MWHFAQQKVAECPVCKLTGSIQLFMNRSSEVRYAMARNYSHLYKDPKKPQFNYCKIENLDNLKTLLPHEFISATILDQERDQNQAIVNQKLKELNPVSKSTINHEGRSSSLVRTLALRAKGRRSESGSAHHLPFLVF